jgi:AraC family transcriptional regulator
MPSRWELRSEDTALILAVPVELAGGGEEIVSRFQIRDPQVEHIGWAAKSEMERGFPNGRLYLDALATALAIHLVNRHSAGSRPGAIDARGGLPARRLRTVLGYIDDHIAESLSLPELAAIAGLGVSHFSAAFRTSMGDSPHRYVTRRRVDRARALLCEEKLSISEVAAATGFAHASHMAHHMRRLLGVTPSKAAR